ncbi:hypothetical protein C809_04064 [Lachnospiraceae bacterium MD335]|nr:hypothetical protein C809_04064 [Lachnospiraceae bacterium MD335]
MRKDTQKQWEEKNRVQQKLRFQRSIRAAAATAAAVCILFTAALNTSPVFAKEAAQLPVIGGLARVLTFRSYETEKDDIAVSVEIPTIEMIAADTKITADNINQEILTLCNQYADDAVLRAEEYRTAFLETGGTPEEWAEHNIKMQNSEEGGFTGISENTKFYINENNRPVIVFEKYEIAPGAAGEITFEIAEKEN